MTVSAGTAPQALPQLGPFTRVSRSLSRGAARYLNTKPFRLRNDRPMVSFTFDDVPDSAFLNGARILDASGIAGTFYIAPGTCGELDEHWRVISRQDVQALAAAGHEIGGHTYSHVRIQHLTPSKLRDEIKRSAEVFGALCDGVNIRNFAYPFGVASLRRKLILQRQYDSCRSIYAGLNTKCVDLGMLASEEMYDRTLDEARLEQLLDRTEETNGWLILYTHDVADDPSWIGCSPRLMQRVVSAVRARGLECVSVAEGLKRAGYPAAPR